MIYAVKTIKTKKARKTEAIKYPTFSETVLKNLLKKLFFFILQLLLPIELF